MLALARQKAGVPLGTVIWKPPMDHRPESAPQDRPGWPGRSSAHRVETAGPKGQPPRSRSMYSSRKYWIDDMLRTPGGGQQLSATHSQKPWPAPPVRPSSAPSPPGIHALERRRLLGQVAAPFPASLFSRLARLRHYPGDYAGAARPAALTATIGGLLPQAADARRLAAGTRSVLFIARVTSDNAAVYGSYLLQAFVGRLATLALSRRPTGWSPRSAGTSRKPAKPRRGAGPPRRGARGWRGSEADEVFETGRPQTH